MGIFGSGKEDAAIGALQNSRDMYGNIKAPDLTWQNYDPTAFQSQTANANTVKEDPSLVSNQMDALNRMSGLSQNGLSDVDQAAYARARSDAGQISSQQTGAALQNAQDRGLSGSGMEFAMREQAGQNAANSAQSADLQQAGDAAKMRAMYTQAYGNQAGQIRGQNYNTQSGNANILNQFNMANTQQQNQTAAANTQQSNQAQLTNQQGRTGLQQQTFNNQMARAGGIAQANSGVAQGQAAQDAASTAQTNAMIGTAANVAANVYTGGMYGAATGAMKQSRGGGQAGPDSSNFGNYAAHGGMIPGVAPVQGDSLMNDNVQMNLSPGEMVIPRSHAQSPGLAKAFVDHMWGKK
jgi:hypothetical protein